MILAHKNTAYGYARTSIFSSIFLFMLVVLSACGGSSSSSTPPIAQAPEEPEEPAAAEPLSFTAAIGLDNNTVTNALLSQNPGGPGGSSNQSFRGGDALSGTADNDVIIGGLGIDVLRGLAGDDILIGGTEDFNSNVDGDAASSDNRDRAYGGAGDDAFIWAPGDGSDFFDGGDGTDVLIFGVLGESTDATGATDGAPFFAVNPPGSEGSQDFDGVDLDENSQPRVRASNSPGFCSLVDAAANRDELAALNIDHIVRFSLRGIAEAFDAGDRTDDDGLRVAVSTRNTEFLVCTRRAFDENSGLDNVEVFDISGEVPVEADIEALPEYVQALII